MLCNLLRVCPNRNSLKRLVGDIATTCWHCMCNVQGDIAMCPAMLSIESELDRFCSNQVACNAQSNLGANITAYDGEGHINTWQHTCWGPNMFFFNVGCVCDHLSFKKLFLQLLNTEPMSRYFKPSSNPVSANRNRPVQIDTAVRFFCHFADPSQQSYISIMLLTSSGSK